MVKFFDMDFAKKSIAIAVLRCMATFFITNTHLDQVYPTDKLAIGGLIGDVLFFMISGFCLINSRQNNFIKWYLARFFRVYPAVFVMILVNLAVGYFVITDYFNWFNAFIYPTFFDFAGAILVLYVFFYIVKRFLNNTKAISISVGVVGVAMIVFYIFVTDKSAYVMNDVGNPITLFLYFESMLIGALIKKTGDANKKDNKAYVKWIGISVAFILFAVYMVIYLTITRNSTLFDIQIVINIVMLIAIAVLFVSVLKFEEFFRSWKKWILNVIWFVSNLTLELYVVQKVIIDNLDHIAFPINLFLIIIAVFVAASVLHIVTNSISKFMNKQINKL